MDLDALERAANAQPDNADLRIQWMTARARIEGAAVYLEPLFDIGRWREEPAPLQDMAVAEAQSSLGETWQFQGLRAFPCGDLNDRLGCFHRADLDMDFVLVPGSTRGGSSPLLAARWPVTWRQYYGRARTVDKPVSGLSQRDCSRFLQLKGLRLPTRSEWHYLCHATMNTRYFWGPDFDPSYCWYLDNSGYGEVVNSGLPYEEGLMGSDWVRFSHSPEFHDRHGKWNAFGLIDMIGNIWEWSQDQEGPTEVHGGSFQSRPDELYRPRLQITEQNLAVVPIGFRPVMSLSL